jgi:hypothetical protein
MPAAQMKINNLLMVNRPFIVFLRYIEDGYSVSLGAISQDYEDLSPSRDVYLYCWKEAVKNILK